MAGRSIMVAFALSAMALVASAGCADTSDLTTQSYSSPEPAASSALAARPSSAVLAMVLATDNAAAGPTPSASPADMREDADLRGFTGDETDADGASPFTFQFGPSLTATYGPSAALATTPGSGEWRPLEFSIAGPALGDLDFSMARRSGSNENINGAATTTGAEVRIGQRLRAFAHQFQSPDSWRHPAWYIFAASDGQALIYTPANDPFSPNRNFTTEDRVNIGSMTAGVSVEAHNMQASFSYVKRKVTTMDLIREHRETDQDFTGFTFTWRQ